MVEAGCWQGGSSAKFSIVCKLLGYRLHIYDSFEGVPPLTEEEKQESTDFSFQYAADENRVRSNLRKYGELDVCVMHKGRFSETLGSTPHEQPVRVAFIDCDTARGTREVVQGVGEKLVDDAVIYSQDFHIGPVARLLFSDELWKALGCGVPRLEKLCGNLASVRFVSPEQPLRARSR
jgi:O-methyltransferase